MVNTRGDPTTDEEPGSWHLRGVGAWVFALVLWLAGLGGIALFSRDGVEVGWARLNGVPGSVKIEKCVHSSSYALCYGPFDADDGSVRGRRIVLRTLRHDRPGTHTRTWLPDRAAAHAWASDVSPAGQLLPAAPFALLTLIQTAWLAVSLRAWRRRRQRRQEPAPARPVGVARVPTPPTITPGYQEHPHGLPGGTDRRPEKWQDLRGTAAPPGPSTPYPRAPRQPWETSEHG